MGPTVIVVPCFNEERRLDGQAFLRHAAARTQTRFLFVNDGSTDGTLSVLNDLKAAGDGSVHVLDLRNNLGKGEAVRRGVLAAFESDPELVGYWDADLATPLSEIERFSRILGSNPELLLVMGARVQLLGREIVRSARRHYLGRVFATAASLALRLPVYDTQCGAKLFRAAPATLQVFREPFRSRWIFDVEILARLIEHCRIGGGGCASELVYECPIRSWRDVGKSKVRPSDFVRAAFELYAIHRRYMRGDRRRASSR